MLSNNHEYGQAGMPQTVKQLRIKGLFLVQTKIFRDDRGYFIESYKQSEFAALGLPEFLQDNFSFSKQGVLRGLHYQLPPFAQGKLIRVLQGRVWDVAVDIRKKSETFGQWLGVELSEESGEAFYVPAGFAHGFVVLSDTARVLYKITAEYAPEAERGIVWNDADLNIAWPVKQPLLASRDAGFPRFKEVEPYDV